MGFQPIQPIESFFFLLYVFPYSPMMFLFCFLFHCFITSLFYTVFKFRNTAYNYFEIRFLLLEIIFHEKYKIYRFIFANEFTLCGHYFDKPMQTLLRY